MGRARCGAEGTVLIGRRLYQGPKLPAWWPWWATRVTGGAYIYIIDVHLSRGLYVCGFPQVPGQLCFALALPVAVGVLLKFQVTARTALKSPEFQACKYT